MARRQINMKALNAKVVKSGEEFNRAMKALIEASAAEIDEAGRGMMLDLYSDFVEGVPKDTGRAAAGFNVNEEPSEWVPPPGDYKGRIGAIAGENQSKLEAIPAGKRITISSNIEYLPPLENGHSRQAPGGFLAISMRNRVTLFNQLAARYNAKKL